MNIIEKRIESDGFNRALPGVTSAEIRTPRLLAPSGSAGVLCTTRGVAVTARPATVRTHSIAHDENSSQLVNFPYAITTFAILGMGVLATCCGLIGTCAWLAAAGFILTLAGGGSYGWS